MSDQSQDERLKAFLEARRKQREEEKATPEIETPYTSKLLSTPEAEHDHENERISHKHESYKDSAEEPFKNNNALFADDTQHDDEELYSDLNFTPTNEEDEHSDPGVVGPLYADEEEYRAPASPLLSMTDEVDESLSEIPSLDDIIKKAQQHEVHRTQKVEAKQAETAPKPEQQTDDERERKRQEAIRKAEEARLSEFIDKRRQDSRADDLNPDDPYGGDAIARKHLKHLQKYLDRDDIADIKEVVINRPEEVGLEHADGTWEWVKDPDLTQEQLEDIARMLANRSGQLFHPGNPILSVKMPGGHRVQVVAGFNAPSGFVFAMRLQRKEKFGIHDFIMDEGEKEQVKELLRTKHTMLISGGTGTGKTTFLNAIIPSIPEDERLVSLEDVSELRIPHRNWAPLLFAGNDTAQGDQGVMALLNACLRLRPDRIILGEIRKENAFAFCSAINTGHEGSVATIHANSPKMAMDAVINRVLMNGDMPDSAIQVLRRQLIADIQAVVQLTRVGKHVKAELLILKDNEDAKEELMKAEQ